MNVLGIDLGGTSVKMGITDNGKVLARAEFDTRREYKHALADLAENAEKLIKKHGADKMGIGSPGLVNSVAGVVCESNNFGWANKPLLGDLQTMLRLCGRIANDAKCAALGEALYGAGRGYDRVAMLTLGTGVGGGFVSGGKIETGDIFADASGIFGHIVIESGGRMCNCGNIGCLEAYCSATALGKRALSVFGGGANAKTLFDAARQGDACARHLVDEFNERLGSGALSIVNILRPQILVLGGGMAGASDLILPKLNEILASRVYGFAYAPVIAAAAVLGGDAGIIGAAALWEKD